jgi:hypothetical protein
LIPNGEVAVVLAIDDFDPVSDNSGWHKSLESRAPADTSTGLLIGPHLRLITGFFFRSDANSSASRMGRMRDTKRTPAKTTMPPNVPSTIADRICPGATIARSSSSGS